MPKIRPVLLAGEVPAGAGAGTGTAVPTTSTWAGALLGGAVGQLFIAGIEFWALHGGELKSATAGSIITVCTFACGYFFKDGRR